jgi:copper chaperone
VSDTAPTRTDNTSDRNQETTAMSNAPASAPTQYLVTGMTCEHCVMSVTEELSEVDGVEQVDVELNVGGASRVSVVTSRPVSLQQVSAAITEAGYQLASA